MRYWGEVSSVAELLNLAEKHVEDGSRIIHDVERDSTLTSTVAMLESRLLALGQSIDGEEPCHYSCKEDDSFSTEGILGNLSGTPEKEDEATDDVVLADQLCPDVSLLAHAEVDTSPYGGAPDAAVATAVAALVANIRMMAKT